MPRPCLVIVTGPPGSGKTTLARRLARDLRLPLIAKDDIKETLFDALGWRDREWSMRLGHASTEVQYHMLARELDAGQSVVAESAFIPPLRRGAPSGAGGAVRLRGRAGIRDGGRGSAIRAL